MREREREYQVKYVSSPVNCDDPVLSETRREVKAICNTISKTNIPYPLINCDDPALLETRSESKERIKTNIMSIPFPFNYD